MKSGPIRELLASMEDEVMSIELDREFTSTSLSAYTPNAYDTVVDLTVSSTHTLDAAIEILQKEGYKIKTLKPKSGRLEEFFLKSTRK